jgi:biofilm PGA synthesis protein PgaA
VNNKTAMTQIYLTKAYIAQIADDNMRALHDFQVAEEMTPGNVEAYRGETMMEARLGAVTPAREKIEASPDLFSDQERNWILANYNNMLASHGVLPTDQYEQRFDNYREALAALDAALADPIYAADPAFVLRAKQDRIVVLSGLQRYRDALTQYEELVAANAPVSFEAELAAGSCYLSSRQPKAALDLFLSILQRAPDNRWLRASAETGLFYAYLECGQYGKAQEIAKRFYAEEPRFVWRLDSQPYTNYRKLDADTLVGYSYAFTEQLDKAERHFREILSYAPANLAAVEGLSSTLRFRGLPEAALILTELGLIHDPENLELRVSRAYALLDMREFRQAEALILELWSRYSEEQSVQQLKLAWDRHNRPEVSVHVGVPQTNGARIAGENEYEVSTRLYSSPFGYNWRVYAGWNMRTRSGGEEDDSTNRYLVGVQYLSRQLLANMTLFMEHLYDNEWGGTLDGVFYIDDHWSIPFEFSVGADVGIRAQRAGVRGNSLGVGVRYVWNESRDVSAFARFIDYSDGNERTSAEVTLHQRLYSFGNFMWDAYADFQASTNTLPASGVAYWNPADDVQGMLTVIFSWRLWQWYEKSFSHRFIFGGGGYWQRNYGTNFVWRLGYEQEWHINSVLSLIYGYEWARRFYDGEAENQNRFYLSLWWRF